MPSGCCSELLVVGVWPSTRAPAFGPEVLVVDEIGSFKNPIFPPRRCPSSPPPLAHSELRDPKQKKLWARGQIIRISLRGLTVESNNKLCLLLFTPGRVGSGYGAPYLLDLPASDELNHAVVVQVVSSGGAITFQSYPQSWTLRSASPNPKATPATVKARFLSKDFLYPGRGLGVGGV